MPDPSAVLPTADLLSRALAGDEPARDALIAAYGPRLHAFLSGRLPAASRSLLETGDVVQEILLRALRTLPSFEYRGHGSFWAHLRAIALNYVADQYRRSGKLPSVSSLSATDAAEPRSQSTGPDGQLLRREELERFESALDVVDDATRRAVLLRLELGLGYDAIAVDTGFSTPDAARMAIRRGLTRIAASLARCAR